MIDWEEAGLPENLSLELSLQRRRLCQGMLALIPLALAGCGAGPAVGGLPVGSALPALRFPVLDAVGPVLEFASFPCLINFWATWCPPCRAEMASLNRLFLAHRSQGLGVCAVSVDQDIHLVREFVFRLPLAFPILLDPGGGHATKDFGVAGFPTTFLVDRSRRIRDVWVGERDWDAPEIRRVVAAMLVA